MTPHEPVHVAHHVFGYADGYETLLCDATLRDALGELEAVSDALIASSLPTGRVVAYQLNPDVPCAATLEPDGSDPSGRPKQRVHTIALLQAPAGVSPLAAPPEAFELPPEATHRAQTQTPAHRWEVDLEAVAGQLVETPPGWVQVLDATLGGQPGIQLRGPLAVSLDAVGALARLLPPEDRLRLTVLPAGCSRAKTDGPQVLLATLDGVLDPTASAKGLATVELPRWRCWPDWPPSTYARYLLDLVATGPEAVHTFVRFADRGSGPSPTTTASRQAFLDAFGAVRDWVDVDGTPEVHSESFDDWLVAVPLLQQAGRENLVYEIMEQLGTLAQTPERRTQLVQAVGRATEDESLRIRFLRAGF